MARTRRIIFTGLMRVAAFFLIWLAIDDNVSEPELLTGIGVAMLATLAASVAARAKTVHARLQPSMLRRWYRLPILLVADSARVSWVLLTLILRRRTVQGRFRAVRYTATSDAEAQVGRRVLTEWSASLAPNRYAIGIDAEAGVLLVHELVDAPGPLEPLELG